MSDSTLQRGFIVFDKSERSLRGLHPLVLQNPDTAQFVSEWIAGEEEILLWVLAVAPEQCRMVTLRLAADLLSGALEEFADDLGEKTYHTRIATGPLEPVFAQQVRDRWQKIGGLVAPTKK